MKIIIEILSEYIAKCFWEDYAVQEQSGEKRILFEFVNVEESIENSHVITWRSFWEYLSHEAVILPVLAKDISITEFYVNNYQTIQITVMHMLVENLEGLFRVGATESLLYIEARING